MPDSSGMRAAGFLAGSGAVKAEMTAIPLAGAAGGLVPNVNRWRSQIDLEPVDEAQLKREVQPITISGISGQLFDMTGPESAGPKRERILVALVEHGGKTWFFKMKGPVDVVAAQKSAFEEFMKSVQLK